MFRRWREYVKADRGWWLESVQDFLFELDVKPCMNLVEISNFLTRTCSFLFKWEAHFFHHTVNSWLEYMKSELEYFMTAVLWDCIHEYRLYRATTSLLKEKVFKNYFFPENSNRNRKYLNNYVWRIFSVVGCGSGRGKEKKRTRSGSKWEEKETTGHWEDMGSGERTKCGRGK